MHKTNIWKIFGFYCLYSLISLLLFLITAGGYSQLIILIAVTFGYLFNGFLLFITFVIKSRKKQNELYIPIKFFKSMVFLTILLQLFLILFNISYYSDIFSYNFIQFLISGFTLSKYALPIVQTDIILLLYFLYYIFLGSFFGLLIRCPNNENGELIVHKRKYDEKTQNVFIKQSKQSFIFLTLVILILILFDKNTITSNRHMGDIFNSGDHILTEKINNILNIPYKRGDIVSFQSGNATSIRRIIALPGEKIKVMGDGRIFINNKLLSEPYAFNNHSLVPNKNAILGETLVPDNEYIMMADNRATIDKNQAGVMVHKNIIIGKVVFRFYPFNRAGAISQVGCAPRTSNKQFFLPN